MSLEPLTTRLRTAGYVVEVQSQSESLYHSIIAATGSSRLDAPVGSGPADVTLVLEASRERFDVRGFELLTRGVWVNASRETVIEDLGGSGFTQAWSVEDGRLIVRTRWSPSWLAMGAATALPSRFRTLRAQVLLHYPVLWWASVNGLAPLHVSVLQVDGVVVLLAGPGGVGKSTLVARELSTGATATCDNLAVSAGFVVRGIYEPLRLPSGLGLSRSGARTTHGRRESAWSGRVPSLTPDLVVVVRRGDGAKREVHPISAEQAQRTLVAGTYSAGELRRFWPLAAILALATREGPVHPPVENVAATLTSRLPCFELEVTALAGKRLTTSLQAPLTELHRKGVGA